MFADTSQRLGNFEWTGPRGRAVWAAGLATLLAAWLWAVAPASAQTPPAGAMYVHSAKSGKLAGGQLTLHGIGPRVTWAHNSGRSGVLSVKRMHRRLFSPGGPAAIGTLHVAGHRGGDELALRLTRPRYNPARRTVRYQARRLGHGRLPGHTAAAAGGFGAASLTMVASQDAPKLTVDNSAAGIRSCGSSSATCWGTLSASGLQPGSTVAVSRQFNCCEADSTVNYMVDQDGTKNVQLPLPCNNDSGISVLHITVSATDRTGQPISTGTLRAPYECVA